MPRSKKTDQTEKLPRELSLLNEISGIVQSPKGADEIFREVLAKIKGLIPYDSASLFIVDSQTGKLTEVVSDGVRVDLIDSVTFDMGKGFSAWVAKEKRTILIPYLRKMGGSTNLKSFLSIPLVSADELIGVLNMGHTEAYAFSEDDLNLAKIIAAQIAFALNRTLYEEELRKKNEKLAKTQKELETAQNRIVEMEKLKVVHQMIVSINHEINNPLTTIIGNLEMLLMRDDNLTKEHRKRIETILNESHRIAKTVNKLSKLKKISTTEYLSGSNESMIDIDESAE